MQLYESYSLADQRYPKNGSRGFLVAPTVEEIDELLKKNSHWQQYKKEGTISNIRFHAQQYDSYKGAVIKLQMEWQHKKEKVNTSLDLASVTIHSIENNCGVVHISNFNSHFSRSGLGSLFLSKIEDWCRYAGYTMIFGNTAGTLQNSRALPFFLKNGYTPMGKEYVNVRSRNTNIWFQKIINTEIPEDNEDEEYDEEDEDN